MFLHIWNMIKSDQTGEKQIHQVSYFPTDFESSKKQTDNFIYSQISKILLQPRALWLS